MLHKIYILLLVVVCIACRNEVSDVPIIAERTVLVYMIAENNLYNNAKEDIAEMQAATANMNGNLIVYLDAPTYSFDSLPQLIHIQNGKLITIKKFKQQNSASGEILQMIINESITAFPALEYGLVLWSHGTGWLHEGVFDNLKNRDKIRQRSFGLDNEQELEIAELAENLLITFEFIAFDACLMSNIETLYQLRDKTNYIIASPTETLATGFPYQEIIPLFFRQNIDYKKITTEYVNYYRKQPKTLVQSASLCVTRTEYLETLVQFILQNIETQNVTMPTMKIKSYEYTEPIMYYDLLDFLQQSSIGENKKNELTHIFSQLVMDYKHTEYFLNNLSLENTTGISFFAFPLSDSLLENQYRQLDWYKGTKLLVNNYLNAEYD
ncbi:MAG: clostripain-related cysteine peptidase [Paludibacteraceae bacterium]